MRSIHSRLLLVATLVLLAFLGIGALALDNAFRSSIEQGMQQRLQQHVYLLLGAANADEKGRMRLPEATPDPRLETIDSGLYAKVVGHGDGYHWQSHSLLGRSLEVLTSARLGVWRYDRLFSPSDDPLYRLHYTIRWEDDAGEPRDYTIMVAESMLPMRSQIAAFRARLFYWMGGVSLLLLIAQALVVAWGLKPLRGIPAQLRRVESGAIEQIEGDFPQELSGLIGSINNLIRSGRATRDRYRLSLGDLAHSLKTPLSLVRSSVPSIGNPQLRELLDEQVSRMDAIVRYQLQRAASSSATAPGRRVAVAELIERLRRTLDKVYRDKSVRTRVEVIANPQFVGDEADLLEVLGNLLENAYKYCTSQVSVSVSMRKSTGSGGDRLQIEIEDDGPGIAPEHRAEVCRRGVRADTRHSGQGIGLSLASEIVQLYRGELVIDDSPLGGASVRLFLPTG
ncbi:MAG: GHKL domain-containing protein [Gammaproteobacteria bacterium]|nr:GHKL domain-containing protein [Gammaproteobacteria bacterium]